MILLPDYMILFYYQHWEQGTGLEMQGKGMMTGTLVCFFFSFYFFSTKCLLTFRTTKMTMNDHHHDHIRMNTWARDVDACFFFLFFYYYMLSSDSTTSPLPTSIPPHPKGLICLNLTNAIRNLRPGWRPVLGMQHSVGFLFKFVVYSIRKRNHSHVHQCWRYSSCQYCPFYLLQLIFTFNYFIYRVSLAP